MKFLAVLGILFEALAVFALVIASGMMLIIATVKYNQPQLLQPVAAAAIWAALLLFFHHIVKRLRLL